MAPNTQEATDPVVRLEADLLRFTPYRGWQIVVVTFPNTAGSPVVVPHNLTVDTPEAINYQVLQTNVAQAIYHIPTDTWTHSEIRLRSTTGGGQAVVLLTTSKLTNPKLTLFDTTSDNTNTFWKFGGWTFKHNDVSIRDELMTFSIITDEANSKMTFSGVRSVIPQKTGSVSLTLGSTAGGAFFGGAGVAAAFSQGSFGTIQGTVISDTITAQENDYSPTGIADATTVLVTPSGNHLIITGLFNSLSYSSFSKTGRMVALVNNGATYNLTLSHASTASTTRYRFNLPDGADVVLGPGEGVWLIDNGTNWTMVGKHSYFSGGTVTIGQNVSASGAAKLRFRTGSGQYNWQIGGQINFSDVFEITPSTAAGGSTFSTPAMTLTRTGDMEILGVLTADGMKFPAAQVASADVNTLDDYEEGSFALSATGITFVSGYDTGRYTKIGRLVVVNFTAQINTSDLSAGTAFTLPLPYTADVPVFASNPVTTYTVTTGDTGLSCYVANTSSTMNFLKTNSGGSWVGLTNADVPAGGHIMGTLSYTTT